MIDNIINIASAFDKNYIVPFYALLSSIFDNNKKNFIHLHVIATGLDEVETKEIEKFVLQNNARIKFYSIDEQYLKEKVYIPVNNHFTPANYYRLFFPSLIKSDINKLLYIDCDTIVLKDLGELYALDIGRAPLAAAPDPYPEIRRDLGINEEGKYFNSGVLLIDIKNWIEQKVTENAMEYILDFPSRLKFVDQDALNAILLNKWFILDKKYNLTVIDVKLQVPKTQLIKDAVIVHYTATEHKPWKCLSRNKLRSLYHKYLKLSPREYEKKYIDFKWSFEVIKVFIRIRVKELYFDKKLDRLFPIKSWINANGDY